MEEKKVTKKEPSAKLELKEDVAPNYAMLNIYQKMSEATSQINKVAKNLSIGKGENRYKAVGEADVLQAVKPIEVALGIYSYPYSREIVEKDILTTSNNYNGKITEKNTFFLRVKTVYRFINTHDISQFIDMITYGDGFDSQDKAPGKAMTYADKYALLKAYKIETGEDPDQGESKQLSKHNSNMSSEAPQTPVAKDNAIANELISQDEIDTLKAESARTGILLPQITKTFNVNKIEEMTMENFYACRDLFKRYPNKETTTGIK